MSVIVVTSYADLCPEHSSLNSVIQIPERFHNRDKTNNYIATMRANIITI